MVQKKKKRPSNFKEIFKIEFKKFLLVFYWYEKPEKNQTKNCIVDWQPSGNFCEICFSF